MRQRGIVLAAMAALPVLATALWACVGDGGTQTFDCPSRSVFTGIPADGGAPPAGASVSAYMERRCGTLDCHGSMQRSMRIFGQYGLRDPNSMNVPGGKPTTLAELDANYGSVCMTEPEKTAKAVEDDGQSAELLLVVLKARGTEAHKGGALVKPGSPGDNCIAGWLRGDPAATVAAACQTALDNL